ncbi:MAG: radical SAM protein [Candidatus Aenigmarchaeota archaeon]|nr:radical SAM protein [Candidatus Aenigmarchaeota archaeon]
MKIVLCTPPIGETLDYSWPPIGLLYIASYLKSKSNHEVKVIDAYCSNETENQFLNQIKKEKPDVIGLSCTSYTFLRSMRLLKKIKQMFPEVIIVLGGIHATFFAEKILKNYKFIDFVVKGEGEITFYKLINNLHNRKKLKNIKGLAFYYKNKIVNNKIEFIEDLDSLPFPDRSLVKSIDYAQCWFGLKLSFGKFTTLLTSRGCPHNCTFCCCSALFKRRWRTRSVENILDELEEIYSQGYDTCIVVDDNFTLNSKRVIKICRGIKKRKIKMNLNCEGRVDKASLEVLKEMKRAGFSTIYFGMESGLQKVLDYYKKGITVEQIKNAVRNAKKARLNVIGSFIIGSPIESKEDILKTLEFATDLHIGLQINSLGIVPGAELWSKLENNNKIRKNDWKSAHSISKYYNNFSEKELLNFIDYSYKLHSKKWLLRLNFLKDIFTLLTGYNIRIISWNLSKNPFLFMKRLIKIFTEGFYPYR